MGRSSRLSISWTAMKRPAQLAPAPAGVTRLDVVTELEVDLVLPVAVSPLIADAVFLMVTVHHAIPPILLRLDRPCTGRPGRISPGPIPHERAYTLDMDTEVGGPAGYGRGSRGPVDASARAGAREATRRLRPRLPPARKSSPVPRGKDGRGTAVGLWWRRQRRRRGNLVRVRRVVQDAPDGSHINTISLGDLYSGIARFRLLHDVGLLPCFQPSHGSPPLRVTSRPYRYFHPTIPSHRPRRYRAF